MKPAIFLKTRKAISIYWDTYSLIEQAKKSNTVTSVKNYLRGQLSEASKNCTEILDNTKIFNMDENGGDKAVWQLYHEEADKYCIFNYFLSRSP